MPRPPTACPPARRVHPDCSAAAVLALTLATGQARAADETVNVATLVTGSAQRTPTSSLRTPCGSSCVWTTASGAAASGAFQVDVGPLKIATWPPLWGANPGAVKPTSDDGVVPAPPPGAPWTGLPEGTQHLAKVVYNDYALAPSTQRHLSAENFRIGNAASVVSYAVRITNTSGQAQAQWLEFTVPTASFAFATATNPLGGPSGYEPDTAIPDVLAARTAVDVVVDGLPVWSSTTNRLVPKSWPTTGGPLTVKAGSNLGTGKTTLFLGTLPVKAVTHVVVVMRTDNRLNAPECKTDHSGSTTYKRCHANREQLSLPSASLWPGSPMLRPAIDVVLN